jgi:hypothetical protein
MGCLVLMARNGDGLLLARPLLRPYRLLLPGQIARLDRNRQGAKGRSL